MNETQRILDTLKRCLRARGMSYKRLGQVLGLSESSIKRLFSEESFSIARLERVCRAIDMTIADLSRMAAGDPTQAAPTEFTLSLEQERILASHSSLLAFFYLLLNGHSVEAVSDRLVLSERATRNFLSTLAAAGLLERRGREIRLHARLPIKWRPEGPVRKLYERQVRAEFLQSEFTGDYETLSFHSAELSPNSVGILMRKLDKLAADFADLVALDVGLPSRDKMSVAMLLATRPWVFSMFSGLQALRHAGGAKHK
jgi:DNA-binding Xre family transcriptional regulator